MMHARSCVLKLVGGHDFADACLYVCGAKCPPCALCGAILAELREGVPFYAELPRKSTNLKIEKLPNIQAIVSKSETTKSDKTFFEGFEGIEAVKRLRAKEVLKVLKR